MATSLPKIRHQANSADDEAEQESTTRQWKRVKRLENDLGFSNLVRDLLPKNHTRGCGQVLSPGLSHDSSRHRRKRRLSAIRSLASIEDSTPLRSPGEQSIPWTQPIGQKCTLGRGNLSHAGTVAHDPCSDVERPSQATVGEVGVTRVVSAQHFRIDRRADGMAAHPSFPAVQKWTTPNYGSAAFGVECPSHTTDLPDDGENCTSADCEYQRVEAPSARQVGDGGRQSQEKTGLADPYRDTTGSCEEAPDEPVVDEPLLCRVLRSTGKGQLDGECDTPGSSESTNKSPVVVVGASSKPKLRVVRAGTSRSLLLSPKNPLSSSVIVAKVKEGLRKGGELRPKVLLVGSGTFNPVHKLHIRRFHLARAFLEADLGMRVVGGIVSPSHPTLVRQRHRVRAAEIIPPKHRLSMARAAVGKRSWLIVDPWEVTRKRIMDYMSVLEHAKEVMHETFPGHAGDITILYVCQASQMHHLNPALLRAGGFGVITVCRLLEKERLLKELSPSFRSITHVVEDGEILGAELEKTSSAMVRHLLKQGKSVEGMVGKAVARYIQENNIAERVSGKQKWTVEDKAFMFEEEDKEDRPYHNLPRVHIRRASQMPLHY